MSSIMIFIFIIYNIFNTTNNGEKCSTSASASSEQLLFEKKLNACATKSFKYEYLIQDEPYQHQLFCNNLHFFYE